MTLERLIMRCDASIKTDSIYQRDEELSNINRLDIDMSPRTIDSIFIPKFTKQAKPCFPYLGNSD